MDVYEYEYFTRPHLRLLSLWEKFIKRREKEIQIYSFDQVYKEFREKLPSYKDKVLADVLRYEFWQDFLRRKKSKLKCPVCGKSYDFWEVIPSYRDFEGERDCKEFEEFWLKGIEKPCVKLANSIEVLILPCKHKVNGTVVMCPECFKETTNIRFTKKCRAILECGHEFSCKELLNHVVSIFKV